MGARLRKTPALLAVLDALLALDRPYGQEVMDHTGRPSGTVYPLLARLEREGWLVSEWETSDPEVRRARRRHYQLTPTGIEHARAAVHSASAALRLTPRSELA